MSSLVGSEGCVVRHHKIIIPGILGVSLGELGNLCQEDVFLREKSMTWLLNYNGNVFMSLVIRPLD